MCVVRKWNHSDVHLYMYKWKCLGDTSRMKCACVCVCVHIHVCVISVRQDDLKSFNSVMSTYCYSLLLPLSVSLFSSYQNLLDGLWRKPRRGKIQGYVSFPWLSCLPIWTNYWRSPSQQTEVCLSMHWESEIERGRRTGDGKGETDRISWVAVIPLPLSHAYMSVCAQTHTHTHSISHMIVFGQRQQIFLA